MLRNRKVATSISTKPGTLPPVHGFILCDTVENLIIDSPEFQRLRGIKQLALAALVYPGATQRSREP